jgi:hypothetical protein
LAKEEDSLLFEAYIGYKESDKISMLENARNESICH